MVGTNWLGKQDELEDFGELQFVTGCSAYEYYGGWCASYHLVDGNNRSICCIEINDGFPDKFSGNRQLSREIALDFFAKVEEQFFADTGEKLPARESYFHKNAHNLLDDRVKLS